MDGAAHDRVASAEHELQVTVVVSALLGPDQLARCLSSLARQSLPPRRFEVVVVRDGPMAGPRAVVDAIRREYPTLPVRLLSVSGSGLGAVRNVGVVAARGAYLTFVDDHDAVSPNYLAALVRRSAPDLVGVAHLVDIDRPGRRPRFDTPPADDLLSRAGRSVPAEELVAAVSGAVGTMVPTTLARSVRFDPDLGGGADVVFWAELLARTPVTFAVCRVEDHAVYYRTRDVSAHQDSFDAGVREPLGVMKHVEALESVPSRLAPVVQQVTSDQGRIVNEYLRRHPEAHRTLVGEVRRRSLRRVPFDIVNRGLGRNLAVLYVAPPYNDTSALVAARRIAAAGDVVDVISCRFHGLKAVDPSADEVWRPYLDRRFETPTRPSASSWPEMIDYCRAGMATLERWVGDKGPYRRMYSRAMWPAAHVLAALYKIRNPQVEWVAEFSDPIVFNMDRVRRVGSGTPDAALLAELVTALQERGSAVPDDDSPFLWTEWLTFALADTILFTNDNQRRYMLDQFPDRTLRARADQVGVVAPHPVPDQHLYHAAPSSYELAGDRVHIGYFGLFYARRGLHEVVAALERLTAEERRRIRLHVFTANPAALREQLRTAALDDVVVARPFVGYLEYLNLLVRFDVLLVNDARTADNHDVNPYVPSKWSEYSGSGTAVWGVVEPNSILSAQPLTYRSYLGDVDGAYAVLEQLVGSG